jgi:hypothetical protein
MKNLAFDHGGTIQLDAIRMDGPLNLSTDGQLLRDYVALHFCAFVYQNGERPKLALARSDFPLRQRLYVPRANGGKKVRHGVLIFLQHRGCLCFVHPVLLTTGACLAVREFRAGASTELARQKLLMLYRLQR